MTNTERLQTHNDELRECIDIANKLPDAESGGGQTTPVATSLIRNGVGYIDTGIDGANSNLTIEIRYEFETMPTGYWYLIRAYTSETANSTRILYNKANYVYCCLNSVPNQSLSSAGARYAGAVYTDILKPENSTTFSYTHNGVKTTKARTSGTALTDTNILLFHPSTGDDGVSIKLYYLKIYDGDTLVRDFIPYISKDGECGLYDKVTKQFYGNVGNGAFEAETINVEGGGEVGVNLYRSYSDKGVQIHKIGTDEIYDEAIDVEGAPYIYEETDIPVEYVESIGE